MSELSKLRSNRKFVQLYDHEYVYFRWNEARSENSFCWLKHLRRSNFLGIITWFPLALKTEFQSVYWNIIKLLVRHSFNVSYRKLFRITSQHQEHFTYLRPWGKHWPILLHCYWDLYLARSLLLMGLPSLQFLHVTQHPSTLYLSIGRDWYHNFIRWYQKTRSTL